MEHFEDRHVKPINFSQIDRRRGERRTAQMTRLELHGQRVKLSVVMAAHNEARTVRTAISEVLAVRGAFDIELVVVDDGSSDETLSIVRSFDDERLVVLRHNQCRGKGAAVLTAAAVATGTHILVFDADLEYSAEEIPSLVEPILRGKAQVVYGARVAGLNTAFQSARFRIGSMATTAFTNLVFDSWVTDMHTCLKLMPLDLFRDLSLTQAGFGLDTEITGELLRRGIRPFEVPCSYNGRSLAAGKKISVRDGFECLKIVAQVRLRGSAEIRPHTMTPLAASKSSVPSPEALTPECDISNISAEFGTADTRPHQHSQRAGLSMSEVEKKAVSP